MFVCEIMYAYDIHITRVHIVLAVVVRLYDGVSIYSYIIIITSNDESTTYKKTD